MIQAIFFDMGNVICSDGYKPGIRQYEREFDIPEGEFYKIVHDFQGWKDFTLGRVSQAQYLVMCQERCKNYHFVGERYIDLVNDLTKPNKALIDYIKQNLSKRYIIGIISNNPKEWYEDFIRKASLKRIVKIQALSCYEHIRKPDQQIFQIALDKAGVKAEESIYVDDRADRIDGAQKLGMHIIIFDGDIDKLKKEIKKLVNLITK
ncbi:hypothetical protein COV56_03590 [Candidatus Kuenenbacteria bacterium CG11_big_fil_rev_8_21_14_0_20_37_9]|nr:MAG: hypothetical protein COV56_03590 [Candidatus Kuenenbacteria bacterium CG11_big_fil_rev_8_21_14_0_20_37_9]